MKRITLILLIIVGFVGCCNAQNRQHKDIDSMRPERRIHNHRPLYSVTGGRVFYDGHEVKDASAASFVILHDGYARDTWNVYFDGVKIDGASSGTFKAMRDGYARDTWNVYFDGEKIDGASPGSFKVMHDGYAKDTWNTYYWGRKI